jgi:O-antigen ligase/tetratricopeptide (TPR) repeat protein
MRASDDLGAKLNLVILAVGAIIVVPLLTLRSTLDPALTPQFLGWAAVSFVLCLVLLAQVSVKLSEADWGILKRAVFPVFLGYFLASVISLAQAVNLTEGIYEVLKIAVSAVFLLSATHVLLRRTDGIATVTKAVVAVAVTVSLIGLLQFLRYGAADRPGYSLLNGTMGHKNLFASGLFLLLPFCLYTVLTSRGIWSIAGIISMALMPPLIILSRSRAVWLALLVTVPVGIVVLRVLRQIKPATPLQTRRRNLCIIASVVVGAVLISIPLAVSHSQPDSLKDFVAAATSAESLFERISVWRKTAEMIRDHALWGVGAGNWTIVFPSYGLLQEGPSDWLKTAFVVRPHNDFLWVWSEVGTLGFLLYAATFVIPLFYAIRIITQRPRSNDSLLSLLMFLGILGYVIIASFSFSRERVFDTVFLLLMMAIITNIYHKRFPLQHIHSRPLVIGVLLVSQMLLSFGVVVGYLRLNAEVHTKRALAARMAHDWPTVIHEIDAACSGFTAMDPTATPLKWYRGEADFASNDLPQAVLDYEQALAVHPYHIHVLNNLATCYVLTNRSAAAIPLYQEAIRIFPRFTEAACNLAAIYFNRGDYAEASEVLWRCGPDPRNATLERYRRIVAQKLASEAHSGVTDSPKDETHAPELAVVPFGDRLRDVHRLWSSSLGRYFYTIDPNERDAFLSHHQQGWTDEGVAYRAFTDGAIRGLAPVYRFHSPTLKGYLYTISALEAQKLTKEYPDQWQYEGVAFHAFPEEQQPQGASPVYRLWSPSLQYHLYTADKHEAEQLETMHSDTWTYEGVAWYAYERQEP